MSVAYDVHPEVEANTREVARSLTDAGAVVEEIELRPGRAGLGTRHIL
ncbi:hypothetical protein [Streptomyces narbonensis]|nr:hypothetical protein [Streptomyces narbonensis]